MAESYAYTPDGSARLVMGAWRFSAVVYASAGGKVYAERWAKRGGFIGLFQSEGWVATTAERLYVEVEFQGLRDGFPQPLTYAKRNLVAGSHQVEESTWGIGSLAVEVAIDAHGSPVGPPTPDGSAAKINVDGVRVNGQGVLDGHILRLDTLVDGRFL